MKIASEKVLIENSRESHYLRWSKFGRGLFASFLFLSSLLLVYSGVYLTLRYTGTLVRMEFGCEGHRSTSDPEAERDHVIITDIGLERINGLFIPGVTSKKATRLSNASQRYKLVFGPLMRLELFLRGATARGADCGMDGYEPAQWNSEYAAYLSILPGGTR